MEIILLGSTGSIGRQTLDVVKENKDKFNISAITCGKNIELLKEQIKEFSPKTVVVQEEVDGEKLQETFPSIDVMWGMQGLKKVVKTKGQLVINGLMGVMGLEPTLAAIEAGKNIALANKETLVAGGELVMTKAREMGVSILPIDSEHSAIFQCLQGEKNNHIKTIYLTASGGPFRNYDIEALAHVNLEDALKHPKWSMGKKITIDSATMVNKGLEVIEAKWLFDMDIDKIKVLVHPQSIVHSMVEFVDGSIKAQLGTPDMHTPIAYAMGYPNRINMDRDRVSFFHEANKLNFEQPDIRKFRGLGLAYEVGKQGGSYPVVFNGANEALVQLFLEKKIRFMDISKGLERILNKHHGKYNLGVSEILEEDQESRRQVFEMFGGKK